ncbi:MAG: hypothetical protein JWL91_2161 [Sphingomonas bacterium]|jgi:hypothetical protein|nr:hypothetical protein [Sphingomonas bacterium]MDB5690285.1 hypothetical protein [Sphingomonas bacterium]
MKLPRFPGAGRRLRLAVLIAAAIVTAPFILAAIFARAAAARR